MDIGAKNTANSNRLVTPVNSESPASLASKNLEEAYVRQAQLLDVLKTRLAPILDLREGPIDPEPCPSDREYKPDYFACLESHAADFQRNSDKLEEILDRLGI